MDRPILQDIEHLGIKITNDPLNSIKDVLDRNQYVFSRPKADIGCCNFVEHKIEQKESAVPHMEGRMQVEKK